MSAVDPGKVFWKAKEEDRKKKEWLRQLIVQSTVSSSSDEEDKKGVKRLDATAPRKKVGPNGRVSHWDTIGSGKKKVVKVKEKDKVTIKCKWTDEVNAAQNEESCKSSAQDNKKHDEKKDENVATKEAG